MSIVYVLFSDDNRYLSVYSSQAEMAKGVDYWMEILPNQTFSYVEQQVDYSLKADCWGWAYIHPNDSVENLTKGGANFIPRKKYWGQNLIRLVINGQQRPSTIMLSVHAALSEGEMP